MAVVGIGHAIIDLFVQAEVELISELGLDPGSMTLIDDSTSREVLAHLSVLKASSGGSAANTLAGVSSLGGATYFVGALGNDQFANNYRDDLEDVGIVFIDNSLDLGASNTGHCIVIVTPDGQRTMLTHLGASIHVLDSVPNIDLGHDAIVCYVEGYLLDSPSGGQNIEAMFSKEIAGVEYAFSLSDRTLVQRRKPQIWELIKGGGISILFGNEDEFLELCDSNDLLGAVEKVGAYVGEGAITLGAKGSFVFSRDQEPIVVPAAQIEVVDTTGAGDLFAAGYLFAREKGYPSYERARMGNICASEVISHFGARPLVELSTLVAKAF
ncbi:adenosine kinase [Acidithrix sp. C25]|uniref:adenosine kinase n=1 Tax=Acidithrix sp. C25 TaxID=1671482 RepID=UPI00191BA34E|nr:adenosine kinase [Acidithrix sp. C25]CAG4919180.1 unnamed protein product [Acidithrix sp. C25]